MSRAIAFDEVRRAVEQFGGRATLISVSGDHAPHVVTAIVTVGDDELLVDAGARTRDNLSERPAVSLVWQPTDGGEYQLILDGTAKQLGEANDAGVGPVSIAVSHGILHRLAGLPSGPPTCRSLAEL